MCDSVRLLFFFFFFLNSSKFLRKKHRDPKLGREASLHAPHGHAPTPISLLTIMRPRSQAQLLWMGSEFDAVPEHVPYWYRHLLLAREMHDTQAYRLTPHTHPAHSPARPADPQIPLSFLPLLS